MYLSEIPFDQLYIGRPVKSQNTGEFGFVGWIGNDEDEWHLREDSVCVCWNNGKISVFPHNLYDQVIDLDTDPTRTLPA